MTPEERSEHMRELGRRGGRATVARHGAEHMSRIGKAGFAATLAIHGGEILARLLADSYQRKFGRPLTLPRNLAAERQRADCRRQHRYAEACARCCKPGTDRHHPGGLAGGNDVITWLCGDCHRQVHREMRQHRYEYAAAERRERRKGAA